MPAKTSPTRKPAKAKAPPQRAEPQPAAPARVAARPVTTNLIAVVGISPAILTETVWALAQPEARPAPIVPDEVFAITTTKGAASIRAQLLTPRADFGGQTVWQSLRQHLLGDQAGGESLTLRVVIIEQRDPASGTTQPLDDIVSQEHNLAAADFILREVRDQTSARDTRLVASLAGGRKTMGALLHAAFTHLARPGDRLTHILVNEPFDGGLQPAFFFPEQPVQELAARDGRKYQARDARLLLADVPFAPMRLRFPEVADIPTRFRQLVQTYVETFHRDASKPALVELLERQRTVVVEGISVPFNPRHFLIIQFFFEANQQGWVEQSQPEALTWFKAYHGAPLTAYEVAAVRPEFRERLEKFIAERARQKPGPSWVASASVEDLKRPLSRLRCLLNEKGASWIPPKWKLTFPPFRLITTP